MDDQIRDLACARAAVQELAEEMAGVEQELANSPLGIQFAQLKKRLELMKSGRDGIDSAIRLEALASFRTTGHKHPHQAVQIKMYATLDYDHEDAEQWCMTSYRIGLKLNKRIFEKAAKFLHPGFVTFGEEPRATISRDLSAYLNREEE